MQSKKLEDEYLNLFTNDDWIDLDSIDSNTENGEIGFTLDYWETKKLYVLCYGQIGGGFTDFCNIEFFEHLEDADKFIDKYNLRGEL